MKEIRNPNPNIRVEATEALKEIGDQEVIKRLAAILALDLLSSKDDESNIEAITLICGHGDYRFLVPALSCNENRAKALEKARRKLPLEFVRHALLSKAIDEEENPIVHWYALLALVELGESSNEILNALINSSKNLITYLDQERGEGSIAFWRALLALSIKDETVRTLSYFKDNPVAKAAAEEFDGMFESE